MTKLTINQLHVTQAMQKASKNAGKKQPVKKSTRHRMVEIGRLLCRSSGPTHLLKQGHLNHSAQDGQVVQMASPQMVTPQPEWETSLSARSLSQ